MINKKVKFLEKLFNTSLENEEVLKVFTNHNTNYFIDNSI